MDLQVKSRKLKRERDTLQRKKGGVSMDLRTELHGRLWGVRNWKQRERERKKLKMGNWRNGSSSGSSFEADRRQIGSDERRREI